MSSTSNYFIFIFYVLFFCACEDQPAPQVISFEPEFGPEETLITVEGMDFNELLAINFNNGRAADFNPSFGTGEALLFRVPEGAELGDHNVEIITEGGSTNFNFRVTQKPPSIQEFFPESASPGESVIILGQNFFEPIEVLFFDSVASNITYLAEDSLVVEVPENVQKGQLRVKANGGTATSPKAFFVTTELLVNDFDGNGARAETNKWLFYGNIDQNAANAIQNNSPIPINNNYLKISGVDPGSVWVGGTESHSFDVDVFENFDITSDINNTFVQFDANNNGRDATSIIIILAERGGSPNDFSFQMDLKESGWNTYRISLNRFLDVTGATINPEIIRTIKFHLFNANDSSGLLELNVDNIKFILIN